MADLDSSVLPKLLTQATQAYRCYSQIAGEMMLGDSAVDLRHVLVDGCESLACRLRNESDLFIGTFDEFAMQDSIAPSGEIEVL